jgi:hypothetical protein
MEQTTQEQPKKRGPGRPRKHPLPEEPPEQAIPEVVNRSALEWAQAILWAAEHINKSRMSKTRSKTPLRHAMWEWGRDNTRELYVQLMPRAMAILEKYSTNLVDEEVVKLEEKAIQEMEELLQAAIEESQQ